MRPTKGGNNAHQLPFQAIVQGPVAFLTFSTRSEAEQARANFQGFQMDPELDLHLKLEFAKVSQSLYLTLKMILSRFRQTQSRNIARGSNNRARLRLQLATMSRCCRRCNRPYR